MRRPRQHLDGGRRALPKPVDGTVGPASRLCDETTSRPPGEMMRRRAAAFRPAVGVAEHVDHAEAGDHCIEAVVGEGPTDPRCLPPRSAPAGTGPDRPAPSWATRRWRAPRRDLDEVPRQPASAAAELEHAARQAVAVPQEDRRLDRPEVAVHVEADQVGSRPQPAALARSWASSSTSASFGGPPLFDRERPDAVLGRDGPAVERPLVHLEERGAFSPSWIAPSAFTKMSMRYRPGSNDSSSMSHTKCVPRSRSSRSSGLATPVSRLATEMPDESLITTRQDCRRMTPVMSSSMRAL